MSVIVKFIRSSGGYAPGEVAGFDEKTAAMLIRTGTAATYVREIEEKEDDHAASSIPADEVKAHSSPRRGRPKKSVQ